MTIAFILDPNYLEESKKNINEPDCLSIFANFISLKYPTEEASRIYAELLKFQHIIEHNKNKNIRVLDEEDINNENAEEDYINNENAEEDYIDNENAENDFNLNNNDIFI
ncbi:4045_t:CDS:2 [Dentiscutata erythropus]|uniref:4045_t:CDS:1 n=1 Tax=Dentiscutata erythropus TaxID=1348616 RepID=A0A9N9EG90_9GLOM|nr:4045_t:CDS:2 [Dentiscutata erythropus]